jgi:3D (Asp-Asp-Asp) domain-containing protein
MFLQARKARASLARLTTSLAAREDHLAALEQQAASATADLEAARAERQSYLAGLQNQRQLNERQISSLEQQAQTAEKRSSTIAAQQAIAPTPAPAAPAAPSPPVSGHGRALTVVATAYALPGTTATGLPVGPGIVAVDPTVIPFGTHMTIPGYGEGVAADTGSAIVGARIDVWVPTEAEANQWGVKTITIHLH